MNEASDSSASCLNEKTQRPKSSGCEKGLKLCDSTKGKDSGKVVTTTMGAISTAFLLWTLVLITVTDALILNRFGSKTTYNASQINSSLSDDGLAKDQNCQLLQVIALMRHGIRYPGDDDIEAGPRITSQFRSRGVKSALVDPLDTVVTRYMPISRAKELSITGGEEQLNMGSRIARRFFKLFSSAGFEDVSFVASSSTRAQESCTNFSKGFAESLGSNISRSIETRNDLLRFFAECPKYIKEVRKNKTALHEEAVFRNMTLNEINLNIANYLNISDLAISADDLDSMYKVAGCEVAIVGSHFWSDLLKASDLDFLEYSEDVQAYWKIGYGYPINYQQSCPLLADIFHHMDDVILGRRTKKGVFYFGHAETLLPLASLLGLFNDGEQLRADNFNRQHQRAFRVSRISSFSANLGFALYKCKSEETVASSTNNGYMVQVLYNEQPVHLPHVCAGDMCPYDVLRKHFSQFIDHCEFKAMCSLHGSDADPSFAADPNSAAVPSASVHIFLFLSAFLLIWPALINTCLI